LEKKLLTILVFWLLLQTAAAKDTTVIFNFPEGTNQDVEQLVSLPNDGNAFQAFIKVAENHGLDMDMTYYESFDSWFVNGINNVQNTQEQYWHFWANNEMPDVGIGAFIPQNNDILELGFADQPKGMEKGTLENAVSWLAFNQNETGEIGEHKVWGNAFSLMALNLFPGNETVKEKAADYLLSNQGEDAGFSYPGFDSDALHTAVATMALISNDRNTESLDINGSSPTGFILSKQENDGGFGGWGSSDVDTTCWAMLALEAANMEIPEKNGNSAADYLVSSQNQDGGFGYQAGQDSSEEYTAEALIALKTAGFEESQAASNGLDWLKGKQGPEGCFSNSYTTALASIALQAHGEENSLALECLEGMQLADNGFGRDNQESNSVDTALAIIALTGNELPTKRQAIEENPGIVAVGSTVKFTLLVSNKGLVSAKNVSVSLEGIPFSWIKQEVSQTSLAEIKPGETIEAEIYAEIREAGQREVFARLSGQGFFGTANSNLLSFEIGEADLSVSLSMQG